MRVLILTREYPPNVYGGAGVHVEHLVRELKREVEVEVRCFGDQSEPGVRGLRAPEELLPPRGTPFRPVLEALAVDLGMVRDAAGVSLVHSHTWYAQLAGFLVKTLHGVPHVLTTHSLEPLRPWKAEQLGRGGHALSSWIERTAIESADAVIAVSGAAREDVLRCYPRVEPARVHVISNGVDIEAWRPVSAPETLRARGVDPARPYVLFVGRATPQKGILHFFAAAARLRPDVQVVALAGPADTPAFAARTAERARALAASRRGVVWVEGMLGREELRAFYSHAAAYCCPSVYEPFGIVNLEAMACGAPVVASKTGGIPEIVEEGKTGFLVPLEPRGPSDPEPRDPESFAAQLAARMDELARDPALRARLGAAGRARVEMHFSWPAIAARTCALYRSVAGDVGPPE
jgi:starch synthase